MTRFLITILMICGAVFLTFQTKEFLESTTPLEKATLENFRIAFSHSLDDAESTAVVGLLKKNPYNIIRANVISTSKEQKIISTFCARLISLDSKSDVGELYQKTINDLKPLSDAQRATLCEKLAFYSSLCGYDKMAFALLNDSRKTYNLFVILPYLYLKTDKDGLIKNSKVVNWYTHFLESKTKKTHRTRTDFKNAVIYSLENNYYTSASAEACVLALEAYCNINEGTSPDFEAVKSQLLKDSKTHRTQNEYMVLAMFMYLSGDTKAALDSFDKIDGCEIKIIAACNLANLAILKKNKADAETFLRLLSIPQKIKYFFYSPL